MKAVMLKSPSGRATLHVNYEEENALSDYSRKLRGDEIVDGTPVKYWPVGVHTVHQFPKDG